jgi:hypothetical protein
MMFVALVLGLALPSPAQGISIDFFKAAQRSKQGQPGNGIAFIQMSWP